MKKIVLFTIFFIGCISILNASTIDSIVMIKGRWAKTSQKHLTIERCRVKSNVKDGQFLHQCSTSTVKLIVEDSTKDGYIISWTYTNISLGDAYKNTDAVTKYILLITKGLTIKFSTDTVGVVDSILNWGGIKNFLTAKADSMGLELGTAEAVDDIKTKLINLIANKRQLQTVLLQDIQLYFSLNGLVLNRKSPLDYSSFFPDQFGGDPFPSKGTINLKSVDTVSNTCIVSWHQEADSAEVKQILTQSITQQATVAGRPAPTPDDIPKIRLYDDYDFVFNYKHGWAQKLIYKRTTATDKMQQGDSVEITAF